MPIHEIQERFTKSELYIMAWRSQEQHHHFKRKMKKHDKQSYSIEDGVRRRNYGDGIIPEGLPDKFFAQEVIRDKHGKIIATPGELALSQVTGEEARKYMAGIGMHFPAIVNLQPRR